MSIFSSKNTDEKVSYEDQLATINQELDTIISLLQDSNAPKTPLKKKVEHNIRENRVSNIKSKQRLTHIQMLMVGTLYKHQEEKIRRENKNS